MLVSSCRVVKSGLLALPNLCTWRHAPEKHDGGNSVRVRPFGTLEGNKVLVREDRLSRGACI